MNRFETATTRFVEHGNILITQRGLTIRICGNSGHLYAVDGEKAVNEINHNQHRGKYIIIGHVPIGIYWVGSTTEELQEFIYPEYADVKFRLMSD